MPVLTQQLEITKQCWRRALSDRIGEHPFAANADGAGSPADMLIDRLFSLHFETPHYASVEPPLPGMPRLLLDDRWVELRLQESASWAGSGLDPARMVLERLEGVDSNVSLKSLLADKESYLILGKPGAGKSTLLRWAAQHVIRETRGQTLIPLLVPLRSYARWLRENPDSRIYSFLWRQHLRLPEKHEDVFLQFMQDVEGGPRYLRNLCRVMLDGWDEVPLDLRADLRDEVEGFRWCLPLLVTSRPVGTGTSFLPEKRYELVQLPFESMRALMQEWFRLVERPELEHKLCAHLDGHLGLRDLARNPYVLTLLCAVVANGRTPSTRAELYTEALELMAAYCREHWGSEGFTFTDSVMRLSERVAYALLDRESASPFEFTAADVKAVAGDETLLATWEKARMVALENEYQNAYAFLHATLQESLAGKELLRRIQESIVQLDVLAADPRWMQPLVLAAGSVGPQHAIWPAVRSLIHRNDRFGLLIMRVAVLLAESGVRDGGQALLGQDLRIALWDLFVRAPDPKPYADALVELDSDFAIDRVKNTASLTPDLLSRFIVLYSKLAPEHPNRNAIVRVVAEAGLTPGKTIHEVDTGDFGAFIGFSPTEAHNLASAKEVRTIAEVLQSLEDAGGSVRQRPLRMRLAMTHSAEAEEFLVNAFEKATDIGDRSELIEALATLGTLAARDAIVRWLQTGPNEESLLCAAFRVLRRFPIVEGADMLLGYLDKNNPRHIRCEAALALGGAQDDSILGFLSDFARNDIESDVEVRKAVLQALARAGCVRMVSHIVQEPPEIRSEISERLVVAGYLGAIARTTTATFDPARVLPLIENYFFKRLVAQDIAPLEISHATSVGSATDIREAIRALLSQTEAAPTVRAAACRAVRVMYDSKALPVLGTELRRSIQSGGDSSFIEEAALAIAFLAPDNIADVDHPAVEAALWRFSLETGQLIFDEEIALRPNTNVPHAAPVAATGASARALVIVATAWGPKHGGINAFNHDFCIALGQECTTKRIICITTACPTSAKLEAEQKRVSIFNLDAIEELNPEETARAILAVLESEGIRDVDAWIGHDVKTGRTACALARITNGRSAVIHHMSYASYESLKSDGRAAIAKENVQRDLLRAADEVLAVGPKLRASAVRLRESTDHITQVVPGLAPIRPAGDRPGVFHAIAFGRLGEEDDRIKLGSLTAAGFGDFVARSAGVLERRELQLTLFGLSGNNYEEENQRLIRLVEERAGRVVNVRASPYLEDRDALLEQMRQNDVALMPSWHEGFGLVGWEAIAARVPLIVAKNSGLYELLDDEGVASGVSSIDVRGSRTGEPNDNDVANISGALLNVAANRDVALQRARQLLSHLEHRYTWENCALQVLSTLVK
jgi:glycosyltransferase involved in cell wall biosynthesis